MRFFCCIRSSRRWYDDLSVEPSGAYDVVREEDVAQTATSQFASVTGEVRGEDETGERSGGQRREMQRQMQSTVEREAREGGLGPRPGGAARQGSENGTYHGALRDRSETVREVRSISQ